MEFGADGGAIAGPGERGFGLAGRLFRAAAVLPGAVQHFSAAQHARGAAVEAGATGLGGAAGVAARRVPDVYDIDTPLDWTPLWSLSHQRVRWLPTAYCYREVPWSDDRRYAINDSNGRAAGNCLEEAVLQGFLELVERDAVAIWWYNRVRRPAFDLDAFAEPYFTALRAHFDGLGWELWALDLTHDLGIPVCAALARERGRGRWCVGFGCHLDARLAVMRGLTELCQLFDPSETRREPWDAGAMPSIEYLLPGDGTRGPGDFAEGAPDDLREAVALCVERAARAGLETLVLDLSRPDVELAVVMVNVPGLRHFWPRFGPGRLYTVPVKMGWRAVPLAEAALNPVPLFL
ncbi:MAG: YcaO-like family protein [Myxococcales bacterium]|nr:YcaO-like family protein [Myxococcales bacterium]